MTRFHDPSALPSVTGALDLSVRFWGVRGSAPVSGPEFLGFGGDTICLEISAGPRRVIVDAGSGLLGLGRALVEAGVREVDLLLTHYHLDHLMGLMTFAPLYRKDSSLTVHAPILDGGDPRGKLARFLDAPFFPVRPETAGAAFSIRTFHAGETFTAGGLAVSTCRLHHPGGACGYRIDHHGQRLAVVADHEHGSPATDGALTAFCEAADLLLYDAPFDEEIDYPPHRGWGHSTWQAGERLRRASGARRLGCMHHAPTATDAILLDRQSRLRAAHTESLFPRQGETLSLGGRQANGALKP